MKIKSTLEDSMSKANTVTNIYKEVNVYFKPSFQTMKHLNMYSCVVESLIVVANLFYRNKMMI
jgi:formate hydrogenlyase subunit 6/NADH:ubiquinone oxidoreductase subunit I